MKLLCVTILFVCAAMATFSQWMLIGCFTINQNYIAKEVCVNKNNPSAHCNGHCYLSKQLHREDKPESPANASAKSKFQVQIFFIGISNNTHTLLSSIAIPHTVLQSVTSCGFLPAPFHPPCSA